MLYFPAVCPTKERGSRPRPSRPAVPAKRPVLFRPQPKKKLGKTCVGEMVSFSLAKLPKEVDWSPYAAMYLQFPLVPLHMGKNPEYTAHKRMY